METNISDSPGDVEITNIRRKNIDFLLHFLLHCLISIISDLNFKPIPALSGGEVNSIHVLVLGGDVDDIGACGETTVGLSQGYDEGVDRVGAWESFVVHYAA